VTAQPRTVVVVDDAAEVRLLLKIQLEQWGNFTVVGEGGDGVEAVDLARVHQPELMVLDVSMPRMDGLEALPHIGEVSPGTKVVMYTGFDERGLAARARALGAAGLIEKSMSIDGLAEQLESVLRAAPPVDVDAEIAPTEPVQVDPSSPEQVLGEHLERFREVFEKAAIGMATMTLTGQVVRANTALAALLGRDVRELVGIGYGSLVAEAEKPALARAFHVAQHEGGVVVRFEHGVQVYGRSRWLLATVAPVRDSRGRALYLFLQAQDVTAQRSAEEALRQSEERFALLVEAVQDYAIFMLDPGGHVASWNTGAQRIKGYQVDEIIGRHFRTFYPEEKQRARHPERELELAIEHGHYEEEGWRVRKDGSQFWASVLITAVYDRNGRHIGFAKVTRDIDERRSMMLDRERAAAALSSANAGLETANQRLAQEAADQAQFLAVTAHEIRSPIGVLTGAAKLLTGHWPELDEVERSELVQSMSTASERLQRLLSDLLMASRLEAKAMQLQLSPTDLSELLPRTIAAASAAQPDGEIRLIGSRGLTVLADADRLAQALDNLIANALRHGRAPVEVAAQQCGATIEITVRDSGPGVAADIQPRLFQRFATGTKRGGTGLGLFIVRELARAHGGDAWYRSIDGGSEFVLSLPTPSTP
jgi:PAS domain S-box-containing protein